MENTLNEKMQNEKQVLENKKTDEKLILKAKEDYEKGFKKENLNSFPEFQTFQKKFEKDYLITREAIYPIKANVDKFKANQLVRYTNELNDMYKKEFNIKDNYSNLKIISSGNKEVDKENKFDTLVKVESKIDKKFTGDEFKKEYEKAYFSLLKQDKEIQEELKNVQEAFKNPKQLSKEDEIKKKKKTEFLSQIGVIEDRKKLNENYQNIEVCLKNTNKTDKEYLLKKDSALKDYSDKFLFDKNTFEDLKIKNYNKELNTLSERYKDYIDVNASGGGTKYGYYLVDNNLKNISNDIAESLFNDVRNLNKKFSDLDNSKKAHLISTGNEKVDNEKNIGLENFVTKSKGKEYQELVKNENPLSKFEAQKKRLQEAEAKKTYEKPLKKHSQKTI